MKRALLLVGTAALLGACGRKDAGTDSANSVNTAPAAAATPGTGDSTMMGPGAASGAASGAAMPNSTSTGGTAGAAGTTGTTGAAGTTGTTTDTTRRDTTRRDTARRSTKPRP